MSRSIAIFSNFFRRDGFTVSSPDPERSFRTQPKKLALV
jgi:hypothetical protein